MAILDRVFEKVLGGRKATEANRRAASQKHGRRLTIQHVEPRLMFSAAMACNSATNHLHLPQLAAPALLAGTNRAVSTGLTTAMLGSGFNPFAAVLLPAAPVFSATALSSSQVNLTWSSVSGASGYVVDVWFAGAWQRIGTLGSSATGGTVSGLNAGTTYYFDVGAFNLAGTTWAANYQNATTFAAAVPPAAPSVTATAASGTQINVAWNAVSGASGYLVDEWINGAWQQVASLGSGTTSYAATGLSAGTTYYFDVAAYNAAGTAWANYVSATTAAGGTGSQGNSGSQTTQITEPTAATAYANVSGSLFGANGPLYLDVHQGEVGDCWLLASLAEVAARDPADITSMFTSAGTTVENGVTVSLYNVRFYNSQGVAKYVTVDTQLPSAGGYYDQVSNGVLWVALAEKAYAEANAAGDVTTQYVGSDSYAALNGGDPAWALSAITGKSASDFYINTTNLAAAWNAGELIVLGSSSSANDNLIVGDSQGTHAYAVVGYSASSSTPFELYNPWGVGSTVGSTISYNGRQVYGGAFYASAAMIQQDFADQSIGNGSSAGGDASRHRAVEAATDLLLARWAAVLKTRIRKPLRPTNSGPGETGFNGDGRR